MERWQCPECKGWVAEHVETHHCYTSSVDYYYPNLTYPNYIRQHYYPISPYHIYSNYAAKISSYNKDSVTSD